MKKDLSEETPSLPKESFFDRLRGKFVRLPLFLQIAALVILALSLPVAVYILKTGGIKLPSRAAATDPHIYVTSSSGASSFTLPPNQTVKVMVDAKAHMIGFILVELNFNQSLIQLTGDVTTTSLFPAIISKTTMANANSTGRVIFALALCDPIQGQCDPKPPAQSGLIEAASFPVAFKLQQGQSVPTQIVINAPNSQLVNDLSTNLVFSTSPADVTIQGTNTPTPGPGSLISNLVVYDSANAVNWSIQNNLQVGSTQYGDRTYIWSTIPSLVLGSQWIRTAQVSRSYNTSPLATFTVASHAIVYLAFDDRITGRPSWTTAYTDTGLNMVNSEPTTYSLLSRDFSAGQTVTLGPNDPTTIVGMYSVIVQPSGGTGTVVPTLPGGTATVAPIPSATPTGVVGSATLTTNPLTATKPTTQAFPITISLNTGGQAISSLSFRLSDYHR